MKTQLEIERTKTLAYRAIELIDLVNGRLDMLINKYSGAQKKAA